MGRIRKCRRQGCDNPVPQSEGRGRPQKYCRHACKIAAFRRRCKKSGKAPRAAAHDGNDEWYTPPDVIEAARQCMGGIDLDPASTAKANETVQAKVIYTVEDDGLTQPWHGRVFLNPPFSAQLKRAFCDRLRESVASGDVTQAVLVTPIDISPQWGDVIRTCASAVAHAVGSTPFYGPRGEHGGPGFGHMVSYYGPNVERFESVFGREWSVWVLPHARGGSDSEVTLLR